MIRKFGRVLLALFLLNSFAVGHTRAQSSNNEVQRYLKPGEYAHALKPVRIGSTVYEPYYISTTQRQIYRDGGVFTHFFSGSVDQWEDQLKIKGMLVLSNGVPIHDEAELFEVFMLSAAEIYAQWDMKETEPLPKEATDNIDKFFDDKYALRKIAFAEQEIQQLFQFESECYANVLRLALAADSPLAQDAEPVMKEMELFAQNVTTAEGAAERLARFTSYNNNRAIREQFSQGVTDLLGAWRGWQDKGKAKGWAGGVLGGYDLDINGIRVQGEIGLDLLKIGVRFLQSQLVSEERVEMLRVLRDFARANPSVIDVDPDLMTAMDMVITEADSMAFSIVTAIGEFVREKAVGTALTKLEGHIAKEWGSFAFRHFGTRLAGHMAAGAVSGIFLGYTISNIAFGLDSVYANTYNARYAHWAHDQLAEMAYTIRTSIAQSTPHVEATWVAAYRASYTFSKLAEIEFYKALAERSDAVWSLKIIIDLFTGSKYTEGVELARDYARITAKYLFPYWVQPPIIKRAVELATIRTRLGAGETSTVLVIDLSSSMDETDPSGLDKIEAAKGAAIQLVRQLGQDNDLLGMAHEVAVVGFSNSADVAAPFSLDTAQLTAVVDGLQTDNQTNLGAGFELANRLLRDEAGGETKYVILMTDGVPNVGLEQLDEFVNGPVAQANSLAACVMSVAFGDDANEALLSGIAQESNCGYYFRAQDAFQLRTVYAQAGAEASGENVQTFSGTVTQGGTVLAGSYDVQPGASVASFYLLWLGSTLELQLINPQGRQLVPDGNRIQLVDQGATTRRVLVKDPDPGRWSIGVVGVDVPDASGEAFSVVASTVSGGAVPAGDGGGGLGIALIFLVTAVGGVFLYVSRQRRTRPAGAQPAGRATLVGLAGYAAGQQLPILKDSLLIGRGAGCDFRIPDPAVSRRHAVIRYAQGAWFLQDQDSAIGTYVNGQRVTAARLNPGDRIAIGGTQFEFRSG